MRNQARILFNGGVAAWLALQLIGGGIQSVNLEMATTAAADRPENIADRAGQAFDDDTAVPLEGGEPGLEGGPSSRDETPQSDEELEPPSGGCIFDRKPLQLMV